jgi:DmsE family decaheme c-type cytochrome
MTVRFAGQLRVLLFPSAFVLLLAGGRAAAAQAAGAGCADCHDAIVKAFKTNPHAHAAEGAAQTASCAACHKGAAEHAQSGDPAQVFSFRKADAEVATDACLECHRSNRAQAFWRGSAHETNGVGCTSCHAVHGGHRRLLAKDDQGETCFSCHSDVRADVMKRSTHPLRDSSSLSKAGQMSCTSCHNPHGARSRALVDARSINDKCYECHTEKKAPVLWEHSPVKEDCLVCHTPHGSTNDKLLVARIPRLCQECHLQGRHQSGTLATNSTFAINRSCLQCHPQVHGSNNPSGPVLQR